MTKKHFEALAQTLAGCIESGDCTLKSIDRFVEFCKQFNPNFSEIRFRRRVADLVYSDSLHWEIHKNTGL